MRPPHLPNRVSVETLDDPRLDDYRNVRDRDLSERKVFLAESEVVLRVLVERRTHPLRSVTIAAAREAKLAPLLERVPCDVPIHVVPQAVLDGVTGFHLHRGVLACAERIAIPDARDWLRHLPPGAATIAVLEGLTNHDNVGSIFRSAAALGATGIVLDDATCDPLYRKAIRVSVGGSLVVPYARCPDVRGLIPDLQAAGFAVWALTPNDPARDITSFRGRRPDRVALLLGSEGPGLEAATLERADERVRVRQRATFDSLNVATACAIALHELTEA